MPGPVHHYPDGSSSGAPYQPHEARGPVAVNLDGSMYYQNADGSLVEVPKQQQQMLTESSSAPSVCNPNAQLEHFYNNSLPGQSRAFFIPGQHVQQHVNNNLQPGHHAVVGMQQQPQQQQLHAFPNNHGSMQQLQQQYAMAGTEPTVVVQQQQPVQTQSAPLLGQQTPLGAAAMPPLNGDMHAGGVANGGSNKAEEVLPTTAEVHATVSCIRPVPVSKQEAVPGDGKTQAQVVPDVTTTSDCSETLTNTPHNNSANPAGPTTSLPPSSSSSSATKNGKRGNGVTPTDVHQALQVVNEDEEIQRFPSEVPLPRGEVIGNSPRNADRDTAGMFFEFCCV